MYKIRILIVSFMAALLLSMAVPASVMAADCEWKLFWNALDNSIIESVSGDDLDEALLTDAGFARNTDSLTYTRQVNGWNEYMGQTDRLPIDISGRNIRFFQSLIFTGVDAASDNKLAAGMSGQSVEFSLFAFGVVRETSGLEIESDEHNYIVWQFDGVDAMGEAGPLLKLWVFDGFLCAVLLIILGVFGLTIYFILRMRRVNKLIENEYSSDNINIKELEAEVERELDQLEK